MARILITGGSSYLGQALVPLATAVHTVAYTFFSNDPWGEGAQLDLRDGTAVHNLVAQFRPDAVIHLAGSNRTASMTAVIEQGAAHIADAAGRAGARLLHLSTDSIFDGRAAPYKENAAPTPVNDYGRAKAAAEAIIAAHPDHLIIRTSLIYDPARLDHSSAWIIDALRQGRPVTLFTNQIRNPVAAETLGRALLELAAMPVQGVLNVAGAQVMSRAEFGLRLLDWWDFHQRETLTLGPSQDGRWPLNTVLDISRARRLLATPLPGVDAILRPADVSS